MPKSRLSKRVILIAVVVILAVAGALWANHKYSGNSANGRYKFSYSQLSAFQLVSDPSGHGMSFIKPSEIGKAYGSNNASTQVTLPQTSSQKNVNIADVTAQIFFSSSASDFAKRVSAKDLSDVQSNQYKYLVDPGLRLINSSLEPAYGFNFGALTPFTNGSIKSFAWAIDFKAASLDKSDNMPAMKGKMVVAIGKNATYYLIVNAVDYNWGSNQKTWQQVFDSLKIDQ